MINHRLSAHQSSHRSRLPLSDSCSLYHIDSTALPMRVLFVFYIPRRVAVIFDIIR